MKPFDITRGIQGKTIDWDDEGVAETFNSWVTNTQFSLMSDTIFYANEVNMRTMTPKQQFDFYKNSLPKKKTPFVKWPTKLPLDDINIIKRAYNYSTSKAIDALKVLDEKQLENLKTIFGEKTDE